jgi:uncharacterized CHY-type Zn-finger protein
MKLNHCKKCGGTDIVRFTVPNTISLFYACMDCHHVANGHPTQEQAAKNWNDENPLPQATICPQCGATTRPVDWEDALEILRSAMQRKLTERTQ